MKLRNRIILGMVALLSLGIGWNACVAQADTAAENAMKSAPQGIKVAPYFTVPSGIGKDGTQKNVASVLANSGNSSLYPMDGVQISSLDTNGAGGAIWSNGKTFDLNQNQRASMWIYISGKDISYASQMANGMAFVLQDDPNMQKDNQSFAFSAPGESLGVWAKDTGSSKNDINSSAIQSSWALEFDTHMNDATPDPGLFSMPTTADYFDGGKGFGYNPSSGSSPEENVAGQHIASGYPADADTYTQQTASNVLKKYYYYQQIHYGILRDNTQDFIGNGAWHHITVDYTAPTSDSKTGSMTYKFDDKDPSTGNPKSTEYVAKVPVDLDKLGASRTDGKVYWGFTGSTGKKIDGESETGSETALVVFEQVPSQVEGTATATMTDTTTNKAVTDSDNTIKANDDVQLTYQANYESGNVIWKNVLAKLQLPADVTFNQITVHRSDGSTILVDPSSISANTLITSIGDMKQNGYAVSITLDGTANNVKQQVTDTTNASEFLGDNGMATATLPSFKIEPTDLALKLDNASKDQTVNLGAATDATITGNLKLSDTSLANSALTIYGAFDSGSATKQTATITGTGDTRAFKLQVPKAQLTATPNPHTLALFVSDGKGAMSDPATATIHMGQVTLGDTAAPLTFTPTFLNGVNQTVARDGDWALNVNDSLKSNSTWTLTAKTAGMFKNGVNAPGNELNGHLFYRQAPDAEEQKLGAAAVQISNGTSDGKTRTTNVADDWTADTGILLDVDGGAVPGDYSGEIQWTLTAAPE